MLFLLNKHYSGRPELGLDYTLTQTVIPPFRAAGLDVEYLLVDLIESAESFERELDLALAGQDVVWICTVNHPWVTPDVVERIRRTGARVVALFFDMITLMAPRTTYRPWQKKYWVHDKVKRRMELCRSVDAIVTTDWPESPYPEKTILFPAPQSAQIFFPAGRNGKTIDVSFAGRADKADRQAYLDAWPDIVAAGGIGDAYLPVERYADLLRSSRMSLNVPEFRRGIDQLTGRPFEILNSRAALLHTDGPTIRRFLDPGRDFIPLEGPGDLPGRVRHYLAHADALAEIRDRGWRRATTEYTAERLWDCVRALLRGSARGA
jgi:hypothetical protein